MILGQQSEVGKWTCPTCGNVYNIFASPSPDPNRASLNCDCGERIVSGAAAATQYDKIRVGQGDPGDAHANPTFPG